VWQGLVDKVVGHKVVGHIVADHKVVGADHKVVGEGPDCVPFGNSFWDVVGEIK